MTNLQAAQEKMRDTAIRVNRGEAEYAELEAASEVLRLAKLEQIAAQDAQTAALLAEQGYRKVFVNTLQCNRCGREFAKNGTRGIPNHERYCN